MPRMLNRLNVHVNRAKRQVVQSRPMTIPLKSRVAKARQSIGLNKAQFAAKIGVTRSALTQIEGGATRSLQGDTAIAIEKLTGYRAQWLVNGDGPEMHSPGTRYRTDEKQQRHLLGLFDKLTQKQQGLVISHLEHLVESNEAIAAELAERLNADLIPDGVPKSAVDLNQIGGKKPTRNVA